jgi:DNA-binding transcriptional MerR regulator
MVNREVVLETIKKMSSSGIDESVIITTLKDIGIKEDEIKQYLAEAKGGSAPSTPKSVEADSEKIAEKTVEKVKQHLSDEKDQRELRETTRDAALEEQHAKLRDVEQNVNQLHEKISSVGAPANKDLDQKLSILEHRISGIEKKIADLKAVNMATKDLMEKVLEVNKKILNKL